jgi:hypothetical protein
MRREHARDSAEVRTRAALFDTLANPAQEYARLSMGMEGDSPIDKEDRGGQSCQTRMYQQTARRSPRSGKDASTAI